jgi:hypothetical protein
MVGDSEKGSARIPCAVLIPSLDGKRSFRKSDTKVALGIHRHGVAVDKIPNTTMAAEGELGNAYR